MTICLSEQCNPSLLLFSQAEMEGRVGGQLEGERKRRGRGRNKTAMYALVPTNVLAMEFASSVLTPKSQILISPFELTNTLLGLISIVIGISIVTVSSFHALAFFLCILLGKILTSMHNSFLVQVFKTFDHGRSNFPKNKLRNWAILLVNFFQRPYIHEFGADANPSSMKKGTKKSDYVFRFTGVKNLAKKPFRRGRQGGGGGGGGGGGRPEALEESVSEHQA